MTRNLFSTFYPRNQFLSHQFLLLQLLKNSGSSPYGLLTYVHKLVMLKFYEEFKELTVESNGNIYFIHSNSS